MLNELLTTLTKRYHDVGHADSAVDHMMDMGGGFGHRVEFGHDLDGFFRAYGLDDLQGIQLWVDHILKDFTSEAGIPLPFSEALVKLTPLDLEDATEWLSVNAADAVELGSEIAALKLLGERFKGNPHAYTVALTVGTALGFVDDNPLLIAYNGALWLIRAKNNRSLVSPELSAKIDSVSRSAYKTLESASIAALGVDTALHALHPADWLPEVFDTAERVPFLSSIADWHGVGEGLMDIADGAGTLGVGFLARKAVAWCFDRFNAAKRREVEELKSDVAPRVVLAQLLAHGAPPSELVGPVQEFRRSATDSDAA